MAADDKPDGEAEDVPSIDEKAVEKQAKRPMNIISTYAAGDEDDDVPDMNEFEDDNNLFANDEVIKLEYPQ